MNIVAKTINHEMVGEVPLLHDKDTRPIKGEALFPEIYSNIFLCSKKKSGKTSTIYKILNSCCGKDTKIIAFCSTLYKDDSWETIRTWADVHGLCFTGHTSLKGDDGEDLLQATIQEMEQDNSTGENPVDSSSSSHCEIDDHKETIKKKKKSKYRSPEYIIIMDDLASELKSTSVTGLLKKNRHFKSKVILSSQYLNDLLPAARKQLDYIILYRGHPDKKLLEVHRDADVALSTQAFINLYKFATKEPFSFLYIDTTNQQFRRNFNTLLKIGKS